MVLLWMLLVALIIVAHGFEGAFAFAPPVRQEGAGGRSVSDLTTSLFAHKASHSRKIWREPADPTQHRDFMRTRNACGGEPVKASRDNLQQHYVYFLRLNSKFTFVFNGLAQVYQCRDYFSRKLHPHTRHVRYRIEWPDHHFGPWYCRLPKGITDTKRQYILKQLDALIERFGEDYDFVYHKRSRSNQNFHDRTDWLKKSQEKRSLYKENLREELHRFQGDPKQHDREGMTKLVWETIEQQVCPDKKSKKSVEDFLQSQIRAALQVMDKMETTSELDKLAGVLDDDTIQPLSKRRQKLLKQKRVQEVEVLEEIGRPIRSFSVAQQDTCEVMDLFWREKNGSSSQELHTKLKDMNRYQIKLSSLEKSISTIYFGASESIIYIDSLP